MRLLLLAKVENLHPGTAEYCALHEGQYPYFAQGFVNMGLPRAVDHTDEIRERSVSFAVADESGNLLPGSFKTAADAEKAIAGAKPTFAYNVELPVEA